MRFSSKLALFASALLSLQVAASPTPQIDVHRELTITNIGVVEDPVRTAPGGAWHFGTMMTNLAGNVRPSAFVEAWLATITQTQTVNGETVFDMGHGNAVTQLRALWPKNGNQLVDLAQSPFRLLAIVNRPDLVKVGPNGPTSFGECRFVYGAFNPEEPNVKQAFFVIFEFDVPADTCNAVVSWANAWHSLGTLTVGSSAYNAALQAITDAVVLRKPGSSRPNQSNLNQLRTNQFDLLGSGNVWILREWNLVATTDPLLATLKPVTTKQTPQFSFLGTPSGRQTLADYMNLNRVAIQAGTHVVPDSFQGASFLSGKATNSCSHPSPAANCSISPFNCAAVNGTKWWAPGFVPQCSGTLDDGDVRHKFALQTCSGCHFQETGTPFFHISNRIPGQESTLSNFLTGENLPQTGEPYPMPDLFFGMALPHSFNDLAHRASVLSDLLALNCGTPIGSPSALQQLGALQAAMGSRVH